jgi:acyl-CoA reductase-like NAD-dependent aldehyde dehydrogenase
VLDIAAWNYPLLIPVNVVVPALLAGNAVLLKHSARTPSSGLHFERAASGMDPGGLVQSLVLTHEATGRLIGSGRIDHVAFTGSVEGGRAVYADAVGGLLTVGLELG